MSNVFANGREISAKKDNNKSICAMPDVCLSPPSPPAGPVPIPYPNTAMSSDTDSGSKTVKIGGSEVGLKNASNYKSSKGDEAATRGLGMGVVTHTIQGKLKHAAWSMDVKIEGKNAIRHMDLTTHNHINNPNIAVVLNQASQNIAVDEALDCKALQVKTTQQLDKKNGDLRPAAMKKENGTTATVASYKPSRGKGGTLMKACSSQSRIKSGKREGYAKSRKGKQKMACTKKSWGGCQNANHTEPKLLEQVFDAARKSKIPMPTKPGALGTLTMNIHWKPTGKTKPKSVPCENCKKGICAAIACGLNVVICKDGKPSEDEPDCD